MNALLLTRRQAATGIAPASVSLTDDTRLTRGLQRQCESSGLDSLRQSHQPDATSNSLDSVDGDGFLAFSWTPLALDHLPPELSHIREAINESSDILDLGNNWDGEGARAYSRATWNRATGFLALNAAWAWTRHRLLLPAPTISAGPDGSIDLHWKDSRCEFLVSVPEDPTEPASFYGDDFRNQYLKGTLSTSEPSDELTSWLTGRKPS